MSEPQTIVSDPGVMLGKPVVAGTRITVDSILEKLAAGETIEQLLDAHPRLRRERIMVVLEFSGRIQWPGDALEYQREVRD